MGKTPQRITVPYGRPQGFLEAPVVYSNHASVRVGEDDVVIAFSFAAAPPGEELKPDTQVPVRVQVSVALPQRIARGLVTALQGQLQLFQEEQKG